MPTKRYVVHFPASDFPFPVKAFWSLTMYEANGFFVSNPLERFALGNRSTVHYNEDGSLNIYMQSAEPTGEQQKENWLPGSRRRIPRRDPSVCDRTTGHRTDPRRDRQLADAADRTMPRKRLHGRWAGMRELRAPAA